MTATELLDSAPAHGVKASAVILGVYKRNGDPDRRHVHKLIHDRKIAPVDTTQPAHRITISSIELRRYLSEGPRQGAAELRRIQRDVKDGAA